MGLEIVVGFGMRLNVEKLTAISVWAVATTGDHKLVHTPRSPRILTCIIQGLQENRKQKSTKQDDLPFERRVD